MDAEESRKLQQALLELTLENDTREKVIALFQKDGYFDENGELAQEYRDSA
jgi:hypothetical protein